MASNVTVPEFSIAPETVVGATPQAEFPFEFPFWDGADIRVLIGPLLLPDSGYDVEGYFIQNGEPVEGGYGSGKVTLHSPVANVTVTIDRMVVGARNTQFSRAAPTPASSLNADLNKVTARQQDVQRALVNVQSGAIDPGLLSEVVGGAVSDRATRDLGNITDVETARDNIEASARDMIRAETGAVPVDLLDFLMASGPVMPSIWDAVTYAVGGAEVDQTAKVQAMFNGIYASRTPDALITRPYYINGPVTIPEDSGMAGLSQGGEEMNKAANAGKRPGVLILGPLGKIICSNKTRIRKMSIIAKDAATQPTTLASAVSRIDLWAGTAIEIPPFAADVDITDNYIVGFDTAIGTNLAERHNICRNKIDCHWGVRSNQTFDTSRCQDNHIWPFWATHIDFPDNDPVTGPNACYMRRGAGVHSNGPNDGWLITNNLVFGFKDGVWVEGDHNPVGTGNNYANRVRGNWIDNRMGVWGSTVTTGVRVTGAVRLLTINDNHIDQCEIGMDLDHTPNFTGRAGIIVTSNTFGACSRRWIRCGVGDGIVDGVMAGGSSGQYGIELKTGCGYWTFDNIHACDALNVEAGTGWVDMFGYNGNDLPKIKVGTVTAYNNVLFDYRGFGTDINARKSGDEAFVANTEAVVTFDVKVVDSLGEFDTATSIFTAKIRGRYILSGCVAFQPATTAATQYGLYLYVKPVAGSWGKNRLFAQNECVNTTGLFAMPFSDSLHLEAGDSIKLQFICSQAATVKSDTNVTYMRIYRLPTARA